MPALERLTGLGQQTSEKGIAIVANCIAAVTMLIVNKYSIKGVAFSDNPGPHAEHCNTCDRAHRRLIRRQRAQDLWFSRPTYHQRSAHMVPCHASLPDHADIVTLGNEVHLRAVGAGVPRSHAAGDVEHIRARPRTSPQPLRVGLAPAHRRRRHVLPWHRPERLRQRLHLDDHKPLRCEHVRGVREAVDQPPAADDERPHAV